MLALFFELDVEWHRHMGCLHSARYECGMAQGVGTESDDRHIFFRIETK